LNESYVVIITCARTPRNRLLLKVEAATAEGRIDDAPRHLSVDAKRSLRRDHDLRTKGKHVQAGPFTFKQGYLKDERTEFGGQN